MSKPNSGLFSGTLGDQYSRMTNEERLIRGRVKGQDLREHPIPRPQLSNDAKKKIRNKIDNRTAGKEEYKHYMWNKRLQNRRQSGIDEFWDQEQHRILTGGRTSRSWTEEQKQAIISGHRPKYNGHAFQAHHTYSVRKYPHLANLGEVIFPATRTEHFVYWHGGNYKNSLPGKPYGTNVKKTRGNK